MNELIFQPQSPVKQKKVSLFFALVLMINTDFNHGVEIAGVSPDNDVTMWDVGITINLEKMHERVVSHLFQRLNRYCIPRKWNPQPVVTTAIAEKKNKVVYSTSVAKFSDLSMTKFTDLVDTCAEVSVIPPKPVQQLIPALYKWQASNVSKIDTYNEKTLTLKIGFGRILNMANQTFTDNVTNIAIRGS